MNVQTTEKQIDGSGGELREPKQVEDNQAIPAWVERSVWTERMWRRLVQSQEGTVWFSLWDKVWAQDNLQQAGLEVILNHGSAGVDGQSTEQFKWQWQDQIGQLQRELREGTYRPLPAKRAWIEKMGSPEKRPLGIPAVRDRVVQAAVKHVLEPIFEREFAAQSHGFRPERSAQQALQRLEELLQSGYLWVVDGDIQRCFDEIPQGPLMEVIGRRIADGKVKALLWAFLKAGVMETSQEWHASEEGTPQGSVISPMLANIYLNSLDHEMAQRGRQMVRYADDFVILCRSEAEAKAALAELSQWMQGAGLRLHPTKTRLVNAAEAGGFDFLGYHFERYQDGSGKKWPRKKSLLKLRAAIRKKTGRMRSHSLEKIIAQINPTLKGWYGYFAQSLPSALESVDGWVRRRLRSIIRWRHKRQGLSRGRENPEYPNHWFTERGLFSMASACGRRSPSRS